MGKKGHSPLGVFRPHARLAEGRIHSFQTHCSEQVLAKSLQDIVSHSSKVVGHRVKPYLHVHLWFAPQGQSPHPVIIFKHAHKRVEVVFSQLCDQMMLKRSYAKTFEGLCTRIISKITAATFLQYLNKQNNRPITHIKHALSA